MNATQNEVFCGWPSFYNSTYNNNMVLIEDDKVLVQESMVDVWWDKTSMLMI